MFQQPSKTQQRPSILVLTDLRHHIA